MSKLAGISRTFSRRSICISQPPSARTHTAFLLGAVVCLILASPHSSFAIVKAWNKNTANATNDWNTGANWDSGTVPTSSDDANITNTTAANVGITIRALATAAANNLTISNNTD